MSYDPESGDPEVPADWWVGMPEEARKRSWRSSRSNPAADLPVHVYDPAAREDMDTDPTGLSPWTKETPGIVEVDLTVDPSPIEVDLPIAPIGQTWVPGPSEAIPRSWVRTEDLLVNPGGWRGWLMKRLSR